MDFLEMNAGVIKEFRENGGNCSGWLKGAPMILVTMTGAKRRTGAVLTTRPTPLTATTSWSSPPRAALLRTRSGTTTSSPTRPSRLKSAPIRGRPRRCSPRVTSASGCSMPKLF